MKLTLNQEKAIKEINNNLQIIACAGSGKTEVITRRIANILKNNHCLPKDIVAFTFTEKAATSMKNRIIKVLTEDKYVNISQINDMYIGTIHGYCFNILNKYSEKYKDFKILDSVKNSFNFSISIAGGFAVGAPIESAIGARFFLVKESASCAVFSFNLTII